MKNDKLTLYKFNHFGIPNMRVEVAETYEISFSEMQANPSNQAGFDMTVELLAALTSTELLN